MPGYASTLRATLLHSGDVLPELVQEHLRKVRGSHDRTLKEEVLLTYVPLVNHVPEMYTDFALDVLRYSPRLGYRETPFERQRLGIVQFGRLFPATPTQGPFLYLLRTDEREGLRLVHGLANWAVQQWRKFRQHPRDPADQAAHDIPIELRLASGGIELWGDQNVYYWFRGGWPPEALAAALMALEVWMEDEIEAGRDPAELFSTVLEGSRCVAVLGACLGIALAYIERCLEPALILLQSPRLWLWDIARFAADSFPSPRFDPTGDYQWADDLNAARAKRPQRSRDIRHLAIAYAMAGSELWNRFEETLSLWTAEQLLQFEEQRGRANALHGAREQLNRIREFAVRENYVEVQGPEGPALTFRPPEQLRVQDEAELAEKLRVMQPDMLRIWARASLAAGAPAAGMDLETAVTTARELQSDSSLAKARDSWSWQRLEAVAGVAAAALRVGYSFLQDLDLVGWAHQTLLEAIVVSRRAKEPVGLSPLHPRAAAAIGLAALLERREAGTGGRERMLELSADDSHEVRDAAFAALSGLWRTDEALCWAAVDLAQALAVTEPKADGEPEDRDALELLRREDARRRAAKTRRKRTIRSHVAALQTGRVPRVPQVPASGRTFNPWVFAPALYCLPPRPLPQADRPRLLALHDSVLAWTISQCLVDDRHGNTALDLSQWVDRLMLWCASVVQPLGLQDMRTHVLAPVKDAWPRGAELTKALLDGVIRMHFDSDVAPTEEVQHVWREVCAWVLESRILRTDPWRFARLGRSVDESVDLIAFGTWLGSKPPPHWPHARVFADVFDTWVRTVGHFPGPYSYFIEFIRVWGWTFAPEPLLEWLHTIIGQTTNLEELWDEHSNGGRTAQLLQRVLDEHEAAIGASELSIARLSDVVDRLVTHGSPLAGSLQARLEVLR